MESLPTHADFASQAGSTFLIHIPGGTTREITLHRVSELVKRPPQEAFSLVFMAPADIPPKQSLYKLEHRSLGEIELFLVPIGEDARGIRFEAVFNQVVY